MKVDVRTPSWFQRYRFYGAGKVPRGYEDWALERLSLGRWIGIYLLIQVVALAVALAVVLGYPEVFVDRVWAWSFPVAALLFAPLWARYYRNKARRALAPPPSRHVLREIGEGLPPARRA